MPDTDSTPPKMLSRAILLCFAVGIFQGFNLQTPPVSAVQLRTAFGLRPTQLGAFFSAGTLGLLFGAGIGGALSDRIGRKPVLVLSTLLFGLASIGNAFATSYETLLLFRVLTGIGMGATFPNLIAIASEAVSLARRSRAVAFVIAGMNIGGGTACALAQWDWVLADWRLLYMIGGVAPALFAAVLFLLLPTTARAITGAAAKARIADLFGPDSGPATLLLWAGSFLLMISIYLLASWLPTLLQARGLDHGTTLQVQVVFNLAGIAGSAVAGWLLDRDPARRSGGIAVLYVGYLLSILAIAIAPAEPIAILLLGGMVGIMVTAVGAVLYALAPALYPARIRGTGIGLGVAVGRIGSIVGPLFAGLLLSAGYSASTVLIAVAPITAVAAVCAIAVGRIAARGAMAANAR